MTTDSLAVIVADMRDMASAHFVEGALVREWADRLAAIRAELGEAAPVAWSLSDFIYDDEGRPIGIDEPHVVWGSENPDPEQGWHPLYGENPTPPATVPVAALRPMGVVVRRPDPEIDMLTEEESRNA